MTRIALDKDPFRGRDPSRGPARRIGAGLRGFFIVAVIVALGAILVGHLTGRLRNHPRYRVDPGQVEILSAPENLGETLKQSLLAVRPFAEPRSLFDERLLADVRDAYAALPWVRSVAVVRREFPRTVLVRIVPRCAFGVIEYAGGRAVVDADGLRLPDDVPGPGTPRPVIRVGSERRPPPTGRRFESTPARHGLAVLRTLLPHLEEGCLHGLRIVAVDATNALGATDPRESEILLLAEPGAVIEWGRSELSPFADLELPATRKIENIARVLDAAPDLKDVASIQVRWREPTYRAVPQREEER